MRSPDFRKVTKLSGFDHRRGYFILISYIAVGEKRKQYDIIYQIYCEWIDP
jgi:hypothetical protein